MSTPYDLPLRTAELVRRSPGLVGQIQNAGLLMQACVPNLRVGDKAKTKAEHLRRLAALEFPRTDSASSHWSMRQRELYEDLGATTLSLTLDADYTHGLALPNPLDSGFTLLPPWGFPPIPSETVRGVAREWLVTCLTGKLAAQRALEARRATTKEPGVDPIVHTPWAALFPEPGHDGASAASPLTIYDAWPAFHRGDVRFRVVGTTPHHGRWYESERGLPDGNENPVPVPHLAVRRGSPYDLAFLVAPGCMLAIGSRADLEGRLRQALHLAADTNAYGPDGTLHRFGIRWDATDATVFVRSLLVSAAHYCGFGSGTNLGRGRLTESAAGAPTAVSSERA